MSIASEISRLQTAKADLKTSIGNKGVTVPASAKLDDYADYVDSIQTGGGSPNIQALSVTSNGTYTASGGVDGYSPVTVNVSGGGGGSSSDAVRFIDYDGTILHTYSAEDFAALTAMPANPTHTGLTSQGWNWTLADAKAQVAEMGSCDIGQMYITDDGKTRIYISLADSVRLSPYLGICPNGTVTVDWGDNTATDTLTGTSLTTVKRVQHTYASTGDYVITLTATSGTFAIYGSNTSSNGSSLLTRTDGFFVHQRCYQNAIQKVELGTNVSINAFAFQYCYALVSITIPSNITSIGNQAFSDCYSLASITMPSGVTEIGTNEFYNCHSLASVSAPSSVNSLATYAFYNCYSLTNISIPSGVISINTYAFSGCSALTGVVIPSGVTSISNNMFSSCNALANITIPSGVTSIGDSAFYYCHALTSINIPSGITSIGANTFRYCFSLVSITIPSGVTSIGNYAFNGCYVLENIIIPNSVLTLGNNAFQDCPSLANATMPNDITSIGTGVFQNCYSLTSISIPSGITSIGSNAFSNCYCPASITVPNGVTSIGSYAFRNCYGVGEYHFLPTTPPTLSATNAFTGILSDCKIYVPAASLTAYQEATNWSTYASYMVGE